MSSDDAGRFVCNYVYYQSLRFAEEHRMKSLFVHFPLFSTISEDTQMKFTASLLEVLASLNQLISWLVYLLQWTLQKCLFCGPCCMCTLTRKGKNELLVQIVPHNKFLSRKITFFFTTFCVVLPRTMFVLILANAYAFIVDMKVLLDMLLHCTSQSF